LEKKQKNIPRKKTKKDLLFFFARDKIIGVDGETPAQHWEALVAPFDKSNIELEWFERNTTKTASG
jgi:hypothetical protein